MAKTTETKDKNIEREYIIPLRKKWSIVPRYKKANKAVKTIKEFLARHMKIRDRDLDKIKIDKYLNEAVWERGIRHPPAKIKVRAVKEGEIVRAELAEMPESIRFKKLRKEKIESSAKEIAKKKKKEKSEENAEEKKEPEKTESEKRNEEEKKESTVEAEEKIEKAEARIEKHTTKAESPKQEKNMRKGYNQSSRGH